MPRYQAGQTIDPRHLISIADQAISIPHQQQLTHLQFRRFAGCPMCNLHIRSFIQGYAALAEAGIQEVAVFHSSKTAMLASHAAAPFALIADPTKKLYAAFGVDSSIWAVLHPKSWLPALKGLFKHGAGMPEKGQDPLGLPADFLIAPDGTIVACKYGVHGYDQWSLSEVLQLAQHYQQRSVGH